MPVNSKFLAARAAERAHRDIAHLRAVCWVPLKRGGHVFARTPILPLSRRHGIELALAGNAFFNPRPVVKLDVFLLLWRLHPHYCAPRLGRESVASNLSQKRFRLLRLWLAFGSLRAAWVHRSLAALVARCDVAAAQSTLDEFIELTYQDSAGAPADSAGARRRQSRIAPERHPTDNLVYWLMVTFGMSHADALDLPIAVGNQLYRERELSLPDGELCVFAPSDRFLSA